MEFTDSTPRSSGSQEELEIVCCPVCHNLTAAGDEPPENMNEVGGGRSVFIDATELRPDCEVCQLLRRSLESFTPVASGTSLDLTGVQVGLYITSNKPILVELSGFVITGGGEAKVVDESLLLFLDRLTEVLSPRCIERYRYCPDDRALTDRQIP